MLSIRSIEPQIWRRLRIPGNITFAQLHRVIQAAFGWLDYHLYHFDFGEVVVLEEDEEFPAVEMYGPNVRALAAEQTLLSELFDSNSVTLPQARMKTRQSRKKSVNEAKEE